MNRDRLSRFFQAAASPMLDDPAMPFPIGAPPVHPALVACVLPPSLMVAAQGLYQLAYENALASTRTSRFELASWASCN